MAFNENSRKELYRCTRCRQCRYVTEKPLPIVRETGEVVKTAVQPICPPGEMFHFEAYYASGKLQLARRIFEGLHKFDDKAVEIVYKCSLCGACDLQCALNFPKIDFRPSKLLRMLREYLVDQGIGPIAEQKKFGESIQENHNPYFANHDERVDWLTGKTNPSRNTHTIYFVGCTAAYRRPEIAAATVELLRKAEVDFAIMHPDEWCCGSPLLRTGQRKLAKDTMLHNVKAIVDRGAKTVVTSCAGCYSTLKNDYPEIVGNLDFDIVHTTELLNDLVQEKKLALAKDVNIKVTYHDPCHLGRETGLYDAPREALQSIPGVELVEMIRTREQSWCCGAGGGVMSAFPELATFAGDVRLKEAEQTTAKALASACPFCKHNFVRVIEKTHSELEFFDVTELTLKSAL